MNLRLLALGTLLLVAAEAHAQTQTTGQISGIASDSTGAVIPKAQITVLSKDTGVKRTTESNMSGYYVVPLLDPGNYTVTVSSVGLQTVSREGVRVEVGHSVLLDFRLEVGTLVEKVTISANTPLIEPSNPNTTTTFDSRQLADLPNPGNDLSYLASLAPGAIMNTAVSGPNSVNSASSANGNVEINGLGSLATDFTIDGLDANNVFANENSTGASGLQLGLNAIREVSVNTAAYAVDQGRLGGAQVSFVTKSGANDFHGNVLETWNGSVMNARDFFLNASPVFLPKPRSNDNQFGASIGGPIARDRLFFFADLEGIRLVLPVQLNSTLPSPGYQQYVLQQLPLGGTDTVLGTQLPPQPSEVPLYQKMFALMGDTSRGVPLPVLGCPFDVGGSPPAIVNTGNGCANQRTFTVSPPTSETLFTLKLDYNQNARDNYWFRFQLNNGSRTQEDPVNSIFNIITPVPIRSGTAGWTHVFNPNLVNQFNPGLSYRSSISNFTNPADANAAFPIAYGVSPFTTIGANLNSFPIGNAVTVWQLNDNLLWVRGQHDFKFGTNMRRALASVVNGANVVPLEFGCSLPEFTFGATCVTSQSFPERIEDRIAAVNLGTYAMDTFKVNAKLTLTAGLRLTWDSNPVSDHHLDSRLDGSFSTIPHDVNRPLNLDILPNQANLYRATPLLQWEPRVAVAYQFAPNSVLRAGFGIFANALPLIKSSVVSSNPPTSNTFSAGIFQPLGGIAIAPGVPNSAVDVAVHANQQFQAGFASGEVSCASPLAPPSNCLPQVLFSEFSPNRSGSQEYPYVLQWSAAIEHQFGSSFSLTARYLGTRGVKLFYFDTPNAYETVCPGCFAPLPFGVAPDPRFNSVFSTHASANSSYHALEVTGQKRLGHGLSFQANYTYSHCLDFNSNGGNGSFNANFGLSPFPGELQRLYGNCDYDVRNALNGSYLYELPFRSAKRWLNHLIGGWQVSGTLSVRGGFPLSVYSAQPQGGFVNASVALFPHVVAGQNPYAQGNITGVTQPGTIQWLNPNAFQSIIDPSTNSCFPAANAQDCQDGEFGRNSLRAPDFRWTDLSVSKRFRVTENVNFRFDTQFFNLFNHPNFGFPSFGFPTAGIPGNVSTLVNFGTINGTVSPTTGLLGAGLGGDSSVRMIALRGTIQF